MNYTSLFLVDDDADDQLLFGEALREISSTASYETATDALDALKKLNAVSFIPHLIFLDLNMPIMHGFECLRRIRENATLQKIPVIIYTTSSSPLDIHTAKQLGAAGYFCKPMHFNHLCDGLKSILNGYWEPGSSSFRVIEHTLAG
jgi:CheY-like chemotaxis protein